MRVNQAEIGLNKPLNPMIQELIKKRWISSQAYYKELLVDFTARVLDHWPQKEKKDDNI